MVARVICFVSPENTFAALADILGFLFLIGCIWWMLRAFVERPVNRLSWDRAALGSPHDRHGVLTAGQFFIERTYILLVFAGIWALMQGVTDIARAFTVRRPHEEL